MEHMNAYRNSQLSANFTREEIACKGGDACCGGVAIAHPLMVQLGQALRDYLGVPLHINSGMRCPTHNLRTPGAVPGSYHTLGEAWDIRCDQKDIETLYRAAIVVIETLGYGHAILYKERGFVHLDIHTRRA